MVIDTTWDTAWPNAVDAMRTANLPFIHIDNSIKPFVRAFIRYLEAKSVYDSAFVFQNLKGEHFSIVQFLKVTTRRVYFPRR